MASVLMYAGGALALAAWLYSGVASSPTSEGAGPRSLGSLPDYAIEIEGELREERSSPAGPARDHISRFAPGGRISILARPAQRVEGAVEARAFLLRGGEARPWEVPITVAEGGAVRITGAAKQLFAGIPPGRYELVIAVGRPGSLPSGDALAASTPGPIPGVSLVRNSIDIMEPSP
jgi:hypothetical protein